ncbi:hypothetical protein A0H81_12376 [Grifola frondosa]|uniref:BHLH domain-containing protein n=1 Tax=Grifola frondosa TaxID=5627 RepID=A0A1C7LUM8_GRIFR|nr:hypothetical protein A0H81_12376 [Grifola frondosa]
MNLDSGAQDQQQKDFMHAFFQQDSNRDADIFHGAASGSQPPMTFQPPLANLQVNMDVYESLMAMQDSSAQQVMQSQSQQQQSQQQQPQPQATTPQVLLEHQLRLSQLQQLQQLQTQIFQQQIELLSGQSSFNGLSNSMDRSRDPQQYGLPTPMSSTELRAQPSSTFVSPMLLHSNDQGMGGMSQNAQVVPNFMPHHMIPPTPHSAPANLVFRTDALPLPSPAELDFGEISPLTSPWLGAYNTSQPPAVSNTRNVRSMAANKRRNTSSSGDESAILEKPARKRPSPLVRAPSSGPSGGKKANARGTRSANSTPLFPSTTGAARPSLAQRSTMSSADIPGDTPSPVDPPMPPPAHPVSYTPLPSLSSPFASTPTPPLPPPTTSPAPVAAPPSHLIPVTPASIMKLGRLGVSTALVPEPSGQNSGGKPKKAHAKTSPVSESSKASKAVDRAASAALISPGLKPIRPAGNATTSSAPSAAPAQPVQFRKSSHKAAEQKRRDSLKTSFDDLRILLPPIPLPSDDGYPDEPILPGAMPPRGPPKGNIEGPNRGVSKLQLLRCGNDYIKLLKDRVDRRDEEIGKLRNEVRRLRSVSGEDATRESQDIIDLERDLDAIELSAGIFGRGHVGLDGPSVDGDEDEEAGE